ncbi:MAG TPA: NAD-dependent DNA ligase LigA [Methylomirabilota bacterium]
MTPAAAGRRIERLRREIRRHDRLYYLQARPEVSDAEYDALAHELADLERRFPDLVTPDSPTQRVAGAVAFRPVAHRVAMLSLDSASDPGAVREFERRVRQALPGARVTWVCEPKVDGLGVALLYRHGRLVRGATRGDGRTGEDVTANLRTLAAVPATLRGPLARRDELEVRGEVFMARAAFARLNRALERRGERTFANPRNAAAGSLRQKEPRVTARRPLDFLAYHVSYASGPGFDSHWQSLAACRAAGVPVNSRNMRTTRIDAVLAYAARRGRERERLPYDADGVVVKIDALAQQRRLGATGHHPRWAIALKFAARQATTRVRAIEVQVGKTGILTPVARLDPVEVGGVVIRNVSLHNEDEITRKDVRVGDTVLLERAGDVIPYVVQVVRGRRPRGARAFRFPARCPACGGLTLRPEGEAYWRCVNSACPAQLKERLRHFGSRRAMDIEHLGEAVVALLVDRGLVRDFAGLYRLGVADVEALEGFGRKSAQNLVEAIAASRRRGLARLLNALGIRLVGEHVARLLARRFRTLDGLERASAEELARIPGVGAAIAESVVKFFADAGNRAVVRRLRAAGVRVTEAAPADRGPLAGRRFVLTGALAGLTRGEAAARIEALGGRVGDTVSRWTDYVVVGDAPGHKLEDARRLRVPTLGPAELEGLLAGDGLEPGRLRQDEVPAATRHEAGVAQLAEQKTHRLS